jgi:monofunctional chorismate mutase
MANFGFRVSEKYCIVITLNHSKMRQIRNQIDGIDKKIIGLLSKRMKLAAELGKLKKKEKLPVLDKKREREMLEKIEKTAKQNGLNPLFAKKLYNGILKESRKIQSNEK